MLLPISLNMLYLVLYTFLQDTVDSDMYLTSSDVIPISSKVNSDE